MPEIKNTFSQGKMNKDLDERIVPNGQYRDALNIQVSTSDGADIGTVQNILGNTVVPGNSAVNTNTSAIITSGYECVGSIADEKNDVLYSFITTNDGTAGTHVSAIVEYTKDSAITPVLVDTDNSVLKFEHGNIITGINVIDNLLFWTDGVNEPKKINIDSFKLNTHTNLTTHSKLFVDGTNTTVDVTEEHITVIKKKPLKTLSVKINPAASDNKNPLFKTIFPRFSYRYRYDDGEYSAFGPFTDVVFNSQYPTNQDGELHDSNTAYSEKEPYNAGMVNMIESIELYDFISPNMPLDVVQIDLLYKQENSNVVYIMEVIDLKDSSNTSVSASGFNSGSVYDGKFVVKSENIYAATPENQLLRPWDNVPKTALAQEVTGNRIVYGNYKQNYTDTSFFPKISSSYAVRSVSENSFDTFLYQNLITNYNFLTSSNPWVLDANVTWNDTDKVIDFGTAGTPAPAFEKMVYPNNGGWGAAGTEYKIAFDVVNYQSGNLSIRLTNGTNGVGTSGDYIKEDIDLIALNLTTGDTHHYEETLTMLPSSNDPISFNGKFWIESQAVTTVTPNTFTTYPTAVNVSNTVELFDVSGLSVGDKLQYVFNVLTLDASGNPTQQMQPVGAGSIYGTWISIDPANTLDNEITAINGNTITLTDVSFISQTSSGSPLYLNGDILQFDTPTITTVSDAFEGSIDNVEIVEVSSSNQNNITFNEGGLPSVKSQRNYQLGVVYGDEFGRETPVFTSAESSVVVPFEDAEHNLPLASYPLQLNAEIKSAHPTWADYYKFYVKETSGEYYNLVMDALYTPTLEDLDSEDHVWLSFASSDRNKISKDDYIILKRTINSDTQVFEDNKFRVLDVQNEAPSAIKYKYISMGEITNTASDNTGILNTDSTGTGTSFAADGLFHDEDFLPLNTNTNNNTFIINGGVWKDNGGARLIQGEWGDAFQVSDGSLYFSFSKELNVFNTQHSEKYRIVQVESGGEGAPDEYRIKLNKAITAVDSTLILSDGHDSGSGASTNANDFHADITVKIEKKVEKDLEAFSGRFFVKILASDLINNELKFVESGDVQINHVVAAFQNVNWQADVLNTINNNPSSNPGGSSPYVGGLLNNTYNGDYSAIPTTAGVDGNTADISNSDSSTTRSRGAWDNILSSMINNGGCRFFIDNTFVSSVQHGEYAREGGYGFSGGDISAVTDISYHCTSSQIPASGVRSWTPTTYLQSISWPSSDSGNFANFGSTVISGTTYKDWIKYDLSSALPLPNTKLINGLEGIITTDDTHTSNGTDVLGRPDGIRRWKTSMFNTNIENTYGVSNSRFYMHLSFLGPGVDLFDGTFASQPLNINDISRELQGIHGGGVFDGTSTGSNYFNVATAYTNVGTNPNGVLMEKPDNSWNRAKNITSIDANGNNCVIPVSGYDTNFQEDHDRQWDPTYGPDGDPGGLIADFVMHLKTPGKKFRFKGDTANKVYTIKSCKVKKVYNHHNWRAGRETNPHQTSGQGLRGSYRDIELNVIDYASTVDANGDGGGASGTVDQGDLENRLYGFGKRSNRRLVYILELDQNPTANTFNPTNGTNINAIRHDTIEFIGTDSFLASGEVATNPAIWETESKDNVDLDIYYEAGQAHPIKINENTNELFAQVGCRVEFPDIPEARQGAINIYENVTLAGFANSYPLEFTITPGVNRLEEDETTVVDYNDAKVRFIRDDGSYTTIKLGSNMNSAVTPSGNYRTTFTMIDDLGLDMETGLGWYNCFSFLNGVESNRIRDDFNSMTITNGVKASATLDRPYVEEHRKSGMIYSGIYNSTSGVNNLNQFIMAEKITKDLNPTYGSIQKLFSRRISLIAFCEDRVVGITANKNALYNADGNPQLVATNMVLGDANPFVGDYGISKNPESFAKESYRAYFTDRQRGAVLRLSMDGLTPISDAGMSKWFKDEFKNLDYNLIGSFDTYKNDYNLTIDTGSTTWPDSKTITYSEDVKGWVSFKSFIQESGVSMSGDYYTFKNGLCYKHDNEARNTFYGGTVEPSTVKFVFNESPTAIKNFNTLNYDGDEGWICESIVTDQENGTVTEFIEKEGKWFNYIKGDASADLDTSAFNFQGIGIAKNIIYNV